LNSLIAAAREDRGREENDRLAPAEDAASPKTNNTAVDHLVETT